MALPVKEQVTYWGIAIAVLVALLWFLGDVLMPFLLGGAIAYCLDPIADWFERLGLSRLASVIVITVFAVILFITLTLLVLPLLLEQSVGLFQALPGFVDNIQTTLTERFPSLMDSDSQLRQSLLSLGQQLQNRGGQIVDAVLGSALSLVNVAVLVVLTPVVTFYLLLDWDNMVARVDALLPRDHRPTIRRLAGQVDTTLASFIRGQGTVCLILGTYYGVALMVVGLNFGLLVGAVAGLISFIPYVGAVVGGLLAIGLALFQYWGEWGWIAAVAGIFFAGQFFEGNILTPKLVGDSVGLHPVWLLFALSVFGLLFGFVGMLIAVPLAAIVGVFVRYGIERYQQSLLFLGMEGRVPQPQEDDDEKSL
ncbi:MAG: AI-2E family transporter [Pseudomonadota bacterium]